MTELALPEQPAIAGAASAMERFAQDASHAFSIAKVLAGTTFVPRHFQNKPYDITAAMLFGAEIGLPQMASLQAVHVIEGRPTITAVAMRGMALAAGVQFDLAEATEARCVYRGKAPGAEQWTEVVWEIDRARRLGLLTKANWKSQPKAMLMARATTELCRLVAANLYIGCPYSAEEMYDGLTDGPAPEAAPPAKVKRTVRREQPAYPEPDPEPQYTADPQPEHEQEAVPDAPDMQVGTRKALMAQFNRVGLTSRDDRLSWLSNALDRDISTATQVSEPEAQALIEHLKSMPADEEKQDGGTP